jgi:ribose/xylose/arabinose/galactoside ABC-type transport system permease subunit
MFVLGIFTERANSVGVTMGMVCSFITQLLVQYYTPLHFLLYAFTGLASCVLFGYLFSLLISTKEKNIQGLTVHS